VSDGTRPPYDVLRSIARADIRRHPYPHIVVDDCLPRDVYAELARTYPDDETILRLSGARDRYRIRQSPTVARRKPVRLDGREGKNGALRLQPGLTGRE